MGIQDIDSAWTGHYDFARWLVNKMKPKVCVDLGVYHGFSTFTLASLGYGTVYAIDNFSIKRSYEKFIDNMIALDISNVEVIYSDFNEVEWDKQIDILHIDGNHHYEYVREDFDKWAKFAKVVLLHDVFNPCFEGPIRVVKEEIGNYHVTILEPSQGLGVLTKDLSLYQSILKENNLPEIIGINYGAFDGEQFLEIVEKKTEGV